MFDEQFITSILRQVECGASVEEVCRQNGIARQTYYRWRLKYGGLLPSEIKRIKQLEDENRRLRRLIFHMTADRELLDWIHPARRAAAPRGI